MLGKSGEDVWVEDELVEDSQVDPSTGGVTCTVKDNAAGRGATIKFAAAEEIEIR